MSIHRHKETHCIKVNQGIEESQYYKVNQSPEETHNAQVNQKRSVIINNLNCLT